MEKRDVPKLLPKSVEKWKNGEMECSTTTSQIYGKCRSGETECSDTTSQIYGEKVILTKKYFFCELSPQPGWLGLAWLAWLGDPYQHSQS